MNHESGEHEPNVIEDIIEAQAMEGEPRSTDNNQAP
jgi:hypothetical protein